MATEMNTENTTSMSDCIPTKPVYAKSNANHIADAHHWGAAVAILHFNLVLFREANYLEYNSGSVLHQASPRLMFSRSHLSCCKFHKWAPKAMCTFTTPPGPQFTWTGSLLRHSTSSSAPTTAKAPAISNTMQFPFPSQCFGRIFLGSMSHGQLTLKTMMLIIK